MTALPNDISFIETAQLTRTFGRDYALHRVDVRFEAGEIGLVLGPNGAGKSTLLGILATLENASHGEIRYGPSLTHRQMALVGRGHIGWVSHDSLLYPELTGAENLDFYARLYGLRDRRGRVAEELERVGMSAAAHRPVRTYSRGMKQRLSVARALLNDPDVLILDEPFNGLDRDGRQRVVALLAEARREGKLVILSTHVLDLPEGFVDQMIVLRRGRVLYAGRPQGALSELYESVLDGRIAGRDARSRRRGARSSDG